MARLLITIILLTASPFTAFSKNIYGLEKYLQGYDKTYFIYVDKKANKLYLMDRNLRVWRKYPVSTGLKKGEKIYVDDFKTPAGVYHIKEIWQYDEPWYIPMFRERLSYLPAGSSERKSYEQYYVKLEKKHKKARKKIAELNSAYLSAKDGHVRYGTGKSLGYNSYGPVYMLLDYPNKDDVNRYEEALDDGKVPRKFSLYFADPGNGIAIHGTNDNNSLGFNASAGCVRMRNDHIIELSRYVMEGTLVIID
jgi:murein L,D-transpeptidase YafK